MLSKKKKYLQIALNSTLDEAQKIITQLPASDRIIIEAGTPLLKRYGSDAIRQVRAWWQQRLFGSNLISNQQPQNIVDVFKSLSNAQTQEDTYQSLTEAGPYVVADYKAMDRGSAEVRIAKVAGANAITVLGQAPIETINILIEECNKNSIDSIIDMMNVNKPYNVLRKLKKLPEVVMLHRGVDETEIGNAMFPIHMINKVKGAFDVRIAIGGGDKIREVQSAIFNGADIVMVWKEFYESQNETADIAQEFLKQIK